MIPKNLFICDDIEYCNNQKRNKNIFNKDFKYIFKIDFFLIKTKYKNVNQQTTQLE